MKPTRREVPAWMPLLIAVLVLAGIAGAHYRRLPRYEGRTTWEWFPTWIDFNNPSYPALELKCPSPSIIPVLRPLLSAAGTEDEEAHVNIGDLWNRFREVLPISLGSALPEHLSHELRQSMALDLLARVAATDKGARALTNLWATEAGLFNRMRGRVQGEKITSESARILASSVGRHLNPPGDRQSALRLAVTLLPFQPELYPLVREGFKSAAVPESLARRFFWNFPATGDLSPNLVAGARWLTTNQPSVQYQAAAWDVMARIYANGWEELLECHGRIINGPNARSLMDSYRDSLSTRPGRTQVTNAFRVAITVLDRAAVRRPTSEALANAKAAFELLAALRTMASPAVHRITPFLLDRHPDVATKAAEALVAIGPVAIESIPDLLPALRRTPTAPPLVCLLARYRDRATAAIPDLTALAEGAKMEAVQFVMPKPASVLRIDPLLARRYGLQILESAPEHAFAFQIRSRCGPTTSSDILVTRDAAFRWGLHLKSENQGASARPFNRPAETVTLASMAAAALREISPEPTGSPRTTAGSP